MSTIATSMFDQPDKPHKHPLLIGLVVVMVAVGLIAWLRSDNFSGKTPAPTISTVQTEPLMPPVTKSRTVIQKKTEYRPVASNPNMQAAYCKNYFAKDVYTYQYLGETDVTNPTISCE